ncbi:MAG TPA: hypothetical protein ENF87_02645 [Thermoproteales archaeon]|nr:hypothetical protein [Thermoproteales archaeon]
MKKLWIFLIVLLVLSLLIQVEAQVPVTVYGYVFMPDGSPAVGASVTVRAGSSSKSTTTDSNGFYKVDLTVSSVPVTITVTAKKDRYQGSKTVSGVEGAVRIDVTLQKVKESTSISISVSRSELSLGDTVTISGRLRPAMVATVYVYVIPPSGTTKEYEVTTSSDGRFSISITVNELGQWKAYAEFRGNDNYKPSTSPTVTFYVKKSISLEVNVQIVNGTVVLQCNSTEDVTAPLDVYISVDNGSSWIKVSSKQMSHGSVEIPLQLTVYGRVLVKVYFHGTAKYSAVQQIKEMCIPSPIEVSLQMKVQNLTQTLNQWISKAQALEESLNETLVKYNETAKALKQVSMEKQQLEAQVSQLQNEKESLQQKVEQLTSKVEELENQVATLNLYLIVSTMVSLIVGIGVGFLLGKRLVAKTVKKSGKEE